LSYAGILPKGSGSTELWLLQGFYTGSVLVEGPQLLRQLNELDGVLDFLKRMDTCDETAVPINVTDTLQASGLIDTVGVEPMALIPRVLDRQQLLRRQIASTRRATAS
jgi:hypothetical protein